MAKALAIQFRSTESEILSQKIGTTDSSFSHFQLEKHLKAFHSFEMCGMLFNGSLEGAPNLEVT